MLLIEAGLVYDHGGSTDRPSRRDILVDGNRIVAVEPNLRRAAAETGHPLHGRIAADVPIIDAHDRIIIPGFFNAHYHSHDTLLKGYFETIPLSLWGLLALPPTYPRRSKRELRLRTLLGAVECLHSGITTVQDMDRVHPFDPDDIDVVLQAYDDVGIRCVFAPHLVERSLIDATAFWSDTIPEQERWRISGPAGPLFPPGTDIVETVHAFLKPRLNRYPRITFGVGPSSPERLTRATLEGLADVARSEGISFYIHFNESRDMAVHGVQHAKEFGGSHLRFLEACGALGPRTSLAHCVWLTDDEIDIFARTGATAAFNPVGNLKTRSGVAPFRKFLDAGVNVGLGCDNCSCSDAQNMFEAMKMFCCLAAISEPLSDRPTAADALRAACLGGAHAAGLGDRLGAVEPGRYADLTLIDLSDPSYVPLNSAARQLVFTEAGRGVRTVVVDGRVVLDQGRVTTIDEAALREEVSDAMVELAADAARVDERLEPIRAAILEAVRRSWESPYPEHRYVGQGHRQ
jgi:guanine deaminase